MPNSEQNCVGACERFREELELVRAPGDAVIERGELMAELPVEMRGHAGECASCLEALDDVVETRNLLLSLATDAGSAKPGSWFTSKVMKAIAAKESEIETRDGFWISIQRLAPRLAAVCALLLLLMGTWAMQTQREYQAREMKSVGESLFETGPAGTSYDDVLIGAEAHR